MELENFFPYRLAVLAEQVSLATAQVYRERFSLTRDEWRVLAALAGKGEMPTADVIERTTLDKMAVSRAVTRLEQGGYLARVPHPEDGRAWHVKLLAKGNALFRQIVPRVEAREEYLLSDLTREERAVLARALGKVEERARQLNRQG